MRKILLCGVFATGCLTGEPITVFGEMSSARSTQSVDFSVVVLYEPEQGDHEAVGVDIHGAFPSAFRLDVPFPPGHAFEEESPNVTLASGSVWIAKPGTTGTRSDGFGDELIQSIGYELLYLVDDPGTQTPFG